MNFRVMTAIEPKKRGDRYKITTAHQNTPESNIYNVEKWYGWSDSACNHPYPKTHRKTKLLFLPVLVLRCNEMLLFLFSPHNRSSDLSRSKNTFGSCNTLSIANGGPTCRGKAKLGGKSKPVRDSSRITIRGCARSQEMLKQETGKIPRSNGVFSPLVILLVGAR